MQIRHPFKTAVFNFVLIILIQLTCVSLLYGGTVVSTVTPSDSIFDLGENVVVTISVDMSDMESPDHNLGSFTGSMSWDASILSYVNDSGILSNFGGVVNAQGSQITFNGLNRTGVTGCFNILTVTFAATSTGTSSLNLEYSAMAAAMTFTDLMGFLTVHDNTVTVEEFEKVALTIGIDPADGGTTDPSVGDHDYSVGTVVDIEAIPDTDYLFSYWDGDVADTGAQITTVTMDTTKELTAHFAPVPESEIHSYATPDDETIGVGDTVSVVISLDMSGAQVPNNLLGSFTGSLAWDSSVLTYVSNSGIQSDFTGIVNGDDGLINFNGANPEGQAGVFNIVRIDFCAVDTGRCGLDLEYAAMAAATTFQSIISDLVVHDGQVMVENIETVSLTMEISPSGGGTTDPDTGDHEYPVGTVVNLEAHSNPGFRFDYWDGTVSDTSDSITTVLMDENKTVTAHFDEQTSGRVEAYVISGSNDILQNDTVVVTLSIDMTGMSAPDEALCTFSGSLSWDPSVLSYAGNSGILSDFTGIVNPLSGMIEFNGNNFSGKTEVFDVLHIIFTGTAEGISPFNLTYTEMAAAGSFTNLVPMLVIHNDSVEVCGPVEYTLSISVDPPGSATTDPSIGLHAYPEGIVIDLMVTPNAGFDFVEWQGDVADPAFEVTSVTMDEDQTVTAVLQLQSGLADVLDATVPEQLHLAQNYPNPFNPATRAIFQVPDPGYISITVYNTAGQTVKQLLHGRMVPGTYQIEWDGTDDLGNRVGSGVYPIVLRTHSDQRAVKAFLMK